MSINKLVVISNDEKDRDFGRKVCEQFSIELVLPKSWTELVPIFNDSYSTFVFWSLTDPKDWPPSSPRVAEPSSPFYIGAVGQILAVSIDPSHVFALTAKPLYHYQDLFTKFPKLDSYFQHSLVKNYPLGTEQLVAKLVEFAKAPDTSGLHRLFDKSTKIQKLTLKSSTQKATAVQALEKTLLKTGFDERIASRVSQATDELLMNAMFDAAQGKNGVPSRQMLDRKTAITFPPGESVDVEFALNNEYFAICVSDPYGTLKKETLFKFLHQNYEDQDYQLRKYAPGAGLGLYGIVASGLSLFASCRPGKRTDMAIFFPRVKSYKDFRKSFQFTVFF